MARGQNIFVKNPVKLDLPRSVFPRNFNHKTSFNAGDLVPFFMQEVLPGDTCKLDIGAIVRMSTPIAPVMDNIYIDCFFFYVPNRIIWNQWKQFMGENDASAWTQTTQYTVPKATVAMSACAPGTIGNYLGLPYLPSEQGNLPAVSDLPRRAYLYIYNEFFRDQNLIAPQLFGKDTSITGTITYGSQCLKAAKFHDYFTSALPEPQKGSSIEIPLLGNAPIVGAANMHGTQLVLNFSPNGGVTQGDSYMLGVGDDNVLRGVIQSGVSIAGEPYINRTNMVADLSQVSGATINQLRLAFQIQKLLEADARGGTRYRELILAHFGVTTKDSTQQIPELLTRRRFRINVNQVLSTTETLDSNGDTANPVGNTGAVSSTAFSGNMFSKSFDEHGLIMGVCVVRHDQTYGTGLAKYWTRSSRYDFYFPEFANIGEQPIYGQELDVRASSSSIFGYQEAWAEYRYQPSMVTGYLNPATSNSLDYWTLANDFQTAPVLGQTFIEQGVGNLDRALSVQSGTMHQFVADFYFKSKWARIMPLYSIPGLIDHH